MRILRCSVLAAMCGMWLQFDTPNYAADSKPPKKTAAEKAAGKKDRANRPKTPKAKADPGEMEPQSSGLKPGKDGWIALFDGKSLDAWRKPGTDNWKIVDGTLAWEQGCGNLWSKDIFGDFILDLEAKCTTNTNSGVYLRGPVKYWHGLEIQVFHPSGHSQPDKHDMGALYDCVAPSVAAEKPLEQWNHFVITFVGNSLKVVLNDKLVVDADLNRWSELHTNPDGSPNKFDWPLKDLPRQGHVGLQDHRTPVWYRNIRIKPLGNTPPAAATEK
jgi:hypothetical protein